ncbi:hypothetical protein CTEN210_06917 [Chaetoceros tenuissimus]|uniref:Reverse transcriptase Ty1/copia-type domain-containing protein n=1 Tax=Chaetoceros tenuissimus TaxID=426638 RepID=A0AAD3CQR8_9STRA|nr:hypothetical protein CTEN210_06917 [Chaetoceros tenuissimus]
MMISVVTTTVHMTRMNQTIKATAMMHNDISAQSQDNDDDSGNTSIQDDDGSISNNTDHVIDIEDDDDAIDTPNTAKQGIKEFGEEAVAVMFKEYKQIPHPNLNPNPKVVGCFDKLKLTRELKRKALRAVNLIKKKRCKKIKGRACANGAPHCKFVPREEASSPPLRIESLMELILFAAVEKRDFAIFDVHGAYLHAELGEDKFKLL